MLSLCLRVAWTLFRWGFYALGFAWLVALDAVEAGVKAAGRSVSESFASLFRGAYL
jgi:bacteriorhodopsin